MSSIRSYSFGERVAMNGLVPPARSLSGRERLDWWIKSGFGGDRRQLTAWLRLVGDVRGRLPVELLERDDAVAAPFDFDERSWRTVVDVQIPQQLASGMELGETPKLAAVAYPFISEGIDRVKACLARHAQTGLKVDEEKLAAASVQALTSRLMDVALQTATMAVNIERMAGRLDGREPEDRAVDFTRRVLDVTQRSNVLAPFPLLDRLLAEAMLRFCDSVDELLQRYLADIGPLRDVFGVSEGRVEGIQFDLGDLHCDGRTVCKLIVDGVALIYKPRGLATDTAFNALVEWIAETTGQPIPVITALDCGDHGWTAFVTPRACESRDEVSLCYWRIGALLCALYVAGGSDIHYENLICAGDEAYIVDLETLLFPWQKLADRGSELRMRLWGETVLRIGYLPKPVAVRGKMVDVSGAGTVGDQPGPRFLMLESRDRDDVRFEVKDGTIPGAANLPSLGSELVPAKDHQREIVEGFRAAYQAILSGRGKRLSELLPAFRGIRTRWVPRGTAFYGELLRASYHPRCMRDGIERDLAFASLMAGEPTKRRRFHARVRAETADLLRGDIPIFHVDSDSCDLIGSRGEVISGYFGRSGYDAMVARIKRMGAADLERQVGLIESSFAASYASVAKPAQVVFPSSGTELLEAALEIGTRLERTAHTREGVPLWTSIKRLEDVSLTDVCTFALYDGVAGIGIFLAELSRATDQPRFARLARQCLRAIRQVDPESDPRRIGAFDGLAGSVYADLRIAAALGDDDLRSVRERLVRIRAKAPADTFIDVISGAAGAALVAARAAQWPELTDVALTTLDTCAARLEATAEATGEGVAWRSGAFSSPLTGFSHGTSGAALALAVASKILGVRRWADLAWAAFRYEASSFDPASGRWRDLRDPDMPKGALHSMAWCHGTPGMTLARQLVADLGLRGEPASLRKEIALGLKATLTAEPLHSHCLCHGAFGNLAPLLRAGHGVVGGAAETAKRLAQAAVHSGWRPDAPVPTPGLMTGLAGIGLALLQLGSAQCDGVLALEARPRGDHSGQGWIDAAPSSSSNCDLGAMKPEAICNAVC